MTDEELLLKPASPLEEFLPTIPTDPARRRERALSRQAAMVGDASQLSALLIGYGGIGSHVLQVGLGLGIERWVVVDPGYLEFENVYPGCFPYGEEMLGSPKVSTALELARNMGIETVVAAVGTAEQVLPSLIQAGNEYDIVMIGTDTLSSRRLTWYNYGRRICKGYWIDGRMGGPYVTVYTLDTLDPRAVAEYEKTLEGQDGELPCGEKSTAYLTGGYVRAYVGQSLADIINGRPPLTLQRYDASNRFPLSSKRWYAD